MKRKLVNTTSKIWSCSAIVLIFVLWQAVCSLGMIDSFLLPSPIQVLKAFIEEFPMLMEHSVITLTEAFFGLLLGILLGFVMAVFMDQFDALYQALPLLKCGYTENDIDTAHPSDMERYYSVEEQKQYGVVGIELS